MCHKVRRAVEASEIVRRQRRLADGSAVLDDGQGSLSGEGDPELRVKGAKE